MMVQRTPDSELTPGALLQRSRQRYGWSIEDVADELKLLPYVVEAIEQDDYSQMAGWTYAVGYLRSYAKLVGIDIDSTISKHKSLFPQKEDGPGTMTHRAVGKVSIPISFNWIVTIMVVIIVIGGLATTYWKRANDKEKVVLESQTPTNQIEVAPEPEPSIEAIAVSNNTDLQDSLRTSEESSTMNQDLVIEIGPGQVETLTEIVQPIGGRTKEDNTQNLSAPKITLVNMDTRIIGSSESLSDGGATTSASNNGRQLSNSATSDLLARNNPRLFELFFDQGSWVDVRDARGEQLLRENVPAGTAMQLEGEPPFTVFVGNAVGVRYLYLGVEQSAPTSGDSIFGRFQLGALD